MARAKEEFFEGHALYLGIDVGKSFHWAIGPDASGEIVINRRVENRTDDVDALLGEAGDDALVVVDQKNNIGSLVGLADIRDVRAGRGRRDRRGRQEALPLDVREARRKGRWP